MITAPTDLQCRNVRVVGLDQYVIFRSPRAATLYPGTTDRSETQRGNRTCPRGGRSEFSSAADETGFIAKGADGKSPEEP